MEDDFYEEDDLIEEKTEYLLDNDELSPEEEGFMKGYNEAEEYAEDSTREEE